MSGPIREFTPTMSSMEMVDFINEDRKARASKGNRYVKLRHDSLMTKAPKVLGKDDAQKFLGVYRGGNGQDRPCFYFPKREACLMAMSYSYELQAKVWDRMIALEDQLSGAKLTTYRDRRPLYDSVLDMVGATGMLFSAAYRIVNAVAGTNHLTEITMEKLETTIPPMQRLGDGTATPHDYARVDKGMIEIYGERSQLTLPLHDPPG